MGSAPEVTNLCADQTVNVLSLKYNTVEMLAWGRVAAPDGWIPVRNLQSGFQWTSGSSLPRAKASKDVRPIRTLQFGTPEEPGMDERRLGAAAMEDLERLFSGLVPSCYQAPDMEGKPDDAGSGDRGKHHRCAACWTTTCHA